MIWLDARWENYATYFSKDCTDINILQYYHKYQHGAITDYIIKIVCGAGRTINASDQNMGFPFFQFINIIEIWDILCYVVC